MDEKELAAKQKKCSDEINAILKKYDMAIAVSNPQPVLVFNEKKQESPIVQG